MFDVIYWEALATGRRLRRHAGRLDSRLRFALNPRRTRLTAPVLEANQVRRYAEDGYLHVPGLIDPADVDRADAAMFEHVGADPADPKTWETARRDPDMLAGEAFATCFEDRVVAAAAQLAGAPVSTFRRRGRCLALNVYPDSGQWKRMVPHIDHGLREARFRTFPGAFRIGLIVYLNETGPDRGGTVVWPGSHRVLQDKARQERRYRLVAPLSRDVADMEWGEPLRPTFAGGDALFFHNLLVHSGSENRGSRPRFALSRKW